MKDDPVSPQYVAVECLFIGAYCVIDRDSETPRSAPFSEERAAYAACEKLNAGYKGGWAFLSTLGCQDCS